MSTAALFFGAISASLMVCLIQVVRGYAAATTLEAWRAMMRAMMRAAGGTGILSILALTTLAVLRMSTRMRGELLGRGRKEQALRLLDAWGAILPIRIAKEDLGDYREDIERRADEGQRWLLWLRVITALVWTGINAVGYVSKNLLGKSSESRSDKQTSK